MFLFVKFVKLNRMLHFVKTVLCQLRLNVLSLYIILYHYTLHIIILKFLHLNIQLFLCSNRNDDHKSLIISSQKFYCK